MHVQRHVQGLGALEDGPESLVVEEHAVGQPMDHGALKPQLGNRAFQLVGGSLGVGGRQGCEGGKPVGVCGDRLSEAIVGVAGQPHGGLRVQTLGRRRAMRDHLDVDTRLVHLLEAELAEVIQAAASLRRPTFRAVEGRRQLAIIVVLFKGDDDRLPLRSHVCSSMRPV